ncbi:hypothetical protein [Microbacterium sp. 77mftsu3.1]|uniref:hypothetical protein n=1 Tax=Microbacterium sp. 77mftsu3.1 TaxID=1761802 RepID=UPI00037735E2|nr:hypothetical protein [Microbacterium sp. 77mftsu3.1]SDH37466.1 hypothetical protein SAMN04488590_3168 [Microbacterium sp. 77mftsu3.1]
MTTPRGEDATARREEAREKTTGRFGDQTHSDPEMTLQAAPEEPYNPVYSMPKSMLPEAIKRIVRANRRLERAGVEDRFTYETEDYIHREEGDPVGVAAVRLTLNAPTLKVQGWKFAAAHEMTADGHILNFGPAKIDEMRCDHCGHTRRRGKVFTVVNEDGEEKVVGSNCLVAFLGIRPEGLWSMTFDLDDDREEAEERDRFAQATGDIVIPARELVGAALAASRDGEEFVPKSKATTEEPSTAQKVLVELRRYLALGEEPERREMAGKILAWVNEQPEGDSPYIDNLRTVLAGQDRQVGTRHFGIGVSAVSAYRNALRWKAEQDAAKSEADELYNPGHIGAVKERFRGRPMTVTVCEVSHTGEHGPSTRVVFRDDETGNQVIWWASGDRSNLTDSQVGQKVTVTATVKEHDQFNGTDQTAVSRAVLTVVEDGI